MYESANWADWSTSFALFTKFDKANSAFYNENYL